uniref:Threonylcarbamoyl-AMP synthase n=1 Tax=Ditylenchus dipsaci TaxID=166011 RepID=A0A915ELB0_9BILA
MMRRLLTAMWRPKEKLIMYNAEANQHAISKAKEVLCRKGVVAMPTDTFDAPKTSPLGCLYTPLKKSPVTILFQRNDQLPSSFNPGVSTIGFRIPMNKLVRELCAAFPNMPLVQTSANVSGSELSPLCVQDFKELWEDLDLIIDDGPIKDNHGSRLGSTIVDLSQPDYFRIVRDGCALEETVRILTSYGLRPFTLQQMNSTDENLQKND